MNAYTAIGHSQTAMERIAALLFALADLAERAGGRCLAVRVLVLLMLRPAEAMARRLVMDFYGDTDIAPLLLVQDGDGPTAAIRLALSLRMLAMALSALPEWAFEGGDIASQAAGQWPRPASACFGNLHEVCVALPLMPAPAHCDTS